MWVIKAHFAVRLVSLLNVNLWLKSEILELNVKIVMLFLFGLKSVSVYERSETETQIFSHMRFLFPAGVHRCEQEEVLSSL